MGSLFMNAPFKQDARMGHLTTVLGGDTLVLLRMVTDEHVNDLFTIKVEALSEDDDLDFDALIGTHATVSLKSFEHPDVPFDGIVTEATFAGMHENGWRYELTLRPWFWLAGRRRNQRIYHEKTVVQILDELLAPYAGLGKPAVEKRLSNSYPTLEYTVQYRESDLAFATRLMERFGISYHFEHADGNHALIMTDVMTAHDPLPGASRKFQIIAEGHRANEEHFWDMRPTRRMTTGGIRLTDYNFKMPNAAMEVDRMGDAQYAEGQIESYDYPGDYLEAGRGKDVARLRTLQERGQDHRHRAVGDCTSMRAGLTVKVVGDKVKGVADPCLCLSASHAYSTAAYASGQGGDGPNYEGSYVLLPVSAPLAPERKTHIPKVQGPQTAVVVGEGEIDCDEYGRILVHFHWDLDKRYSMRCRVSQNWAGKGWGGMVIPRTGMEVVVEFLEGDPDKPLVTGCVYNGKNGPAYPLPDNKTKSVFRTDSHQTIESYAFNELTFEDGKNREEIFVRAARDYTVKIDNHATTRVDENEIHSTGGHSLNETELSRTDTIGQSLSIQIGGGPGGVFVGGDARKDPFGMRPAAYKLGLTGAGARGNFILSAEKTITIDAGKSFDLDVETTASERVGTTKSLNVSKDYKVSIGENSKETVGKRKVIDAHKEILLRCGKSEIQMLADGTININGAKLNATLDDLVKILAGRIDLN